MSSLSIDDPGLMMTVQDIGRTGWSHLGVPESGPMDWFAFRAANHLVGNSPDLAALEIAALGGGRFSAIGELLISVTGVGGIIRVNNKPLPLWTSIRLHHGDQVDITNVKGAWTYLAVAGGVDVPVVMGSRSTCLMAHFGGFDGRQLQKGDILPIGLSDSDWGKLAGAAWNSAHIPSYSDITKVGLLPGPHDDMFSEESQQGLYDATYQVDITSNRMGYRLTGRALDSTETHEILSEGVISGSVQVPKSGMPIILMADHQTVGGYPVVGIVPAADLPLVAQCLPGSGTLSFYKITPKDAISRYKTLQNWLNEPVEDYEIWS